MSLFAKLASFGIGELCQGIGGLAKDLRGAITGEMNPETKALIRSKILEMETMALQLQTKTQEFQRDVIVEEAKGGSWLQRNWRPGLMTIFGIIVANNYIIAPYIGLFAGEEYRLMLDMPGPLWDLLKIGVGGYIVGRSAEKVTEKWKETKD
jgi:hypothetical protein